MLWSTSAMSCCYETLMVHYITFTSALFSLPLLGPRTSPIATRSVGDPGWAVTILPWFRSVHLLT